ncbi:hypothetical protein D9M69_688920 [compost metagenome]
MGPVPLHSVGVGVIGGVVIPEKTGVGLFFHFGYTHQCFNIGLSVKNDKVAANHPFALQYGLFLLVFIQQHDLEGVFCGLGGNLCPERKADRVSGGEI